MNIHKTKIEWCSHTWNPVTGCRHDCPYCYARRIATRFGPKIDEFPDESGITAFINEGVDCYVVEKPTELKDWQGNYRRSTPYPKNFAPTLHKYTLTYPEKRLTPAAIFVGSMADLFGRWVPDDWIEQVFDACRRGTPTCSSPRTRSGIVTSPAPGNSPRSRTSGTEPPSPARICLFSSGTRQTPS